MPEVRFTGKVTTDFGGFYSAGRYNAREGDTYDLTEAEISRLHRDHPGLIEELEKPKRTPRARPVGKTRQVTGGEHK